MVILPVLGKKEKTIEVPLNITEPVLGGSPKGSMAQIQERNLMRKFLNAIFSLIFFFFGINSIAAEKTAELLSPEWSFKRFFWKI